MGPRSIPELILGMVHRSILGSILGMVLPNMCIMVRIHALVLKICLTFLNPKPTSRLFKSMNSSNRVVMVIISNKKVMFIISNKKVMFIISNKKVMFIISNKKVMFIISNKKVIVNSNSIGNRIL